MRTKNYLMLLSLVLYFFTNSAIAQTFDGYALYNTQNSNTKPNIMRQLLESQNFYGSGITLYI